MWLGLADDHSLYTETVSEYIVEIMGTLLFFTLDDVIAYTYHMLFGSDVHRWQQEYVYNDFFS